MSVTTAKLLMIPLLFACALYATRNYSGEVAILYTTDGAGKAYTNRVWVLDHGHEIWIRALDPTSEWYDRVLNHPEVELRRGESIAKFRAIPRAERRERINALMADQYRWAEWLLSKIEDHDE
ncbi:MAG TPA: hypothetical protein VEC18_03810, partial [Myxococcota bacterium]|nr:hypothetical protein [Myxococcota bacterium]